MLNKLKPKSEFSRNVLTLMTGTTIAQAIPIAISPILTRIYTPEDFGFLAIYLFVITFLANIATGKYEMSIYLPNQNGVAKEMLEVSLLLATIFSVILLIIVVLFGNIIIEQFNFQHNILWLYILPFAVLITAFYQSMNHLYVRMSKFKILSINRIIHSSTNAIISVVLGLQSLLLHGLVVAQIISQFVVAILLFKNHKFSSINKYRLIRYILLMKRYINFPKHMLISNMTNNLSANMPIIILTSNFGLAFSGFYSFVQKVFGIPLNVIGNSFSEVFRQKASNDYIQNGNCIDAFSSVFKKLFLISFIPFFIFYFVAVDLFSFVFGENWRVAGEYAQILTPMFFIKFITMPISSVALFANKTIVDFWWQLGFLAVAVVGYLISSDAKSTIIYFSFGFSLMYLISFYINYRYARYGSKTFDRK
ncbi:MAG: oligosaccharide flippase family protein [Campylobacterota bacterium]|nr:oligosaccharide flippase family protein [Campylobacterota bacterium]